MLNFFLHINYESQLFRYWRRICCDRSYFCRFCSLIACITLVAAAAAIVLASINRSKPITTTTATPTTITTATTTTTDTTTITTITTETTSTSTTTTSTTTTTGICNPACLNGGTCVAPNVCQCIPDVWIGGICQTRKTISKMRNNQLSFVF